MKKIFLLLFFLPQLALPLLAQNNATAKKPTASTQKPATAKVEKKDITDSLIVELQKRVVRMDSLISDMKRDVIYSHSMTRERIENLKTSTEQPAYKIYPTEYIHILLRLDTKTGQVSMVQYRMGTSSSMIFDINRGVVFSGSGWNGRFELYPTKNMYTFIMIDNGTGYVYQVQWGTERNKYFVERIYD